LLGRKPVSSNLGVQLLWDHYHQQLKQWCDRALLSWAAQLFGLNRRRIYEPQRHRRTQGGQHIGVLSTVTVVGGNATGNSALAIAALQILQQLGWIYRQKRLLPVWQNQLAGRLQWTTNKASGYWTALITQVLPKPCQFVDTLDSVRNLGNGMLSTKEHADIFRALLRPGDQLYQYQYRSQFS